MQDKADIRTFAAGLSDEGKIDFFGDKTKAALFDAGLLAPEDYFKRLENIDLSGIAIPDDATIRHVMFGEFTNPTSKDPSGRLSGGGHASANLLELERRGIAYNITRTSTNGVRFGNLPRHSRKKKQTGDGQAWFPEPWTEHDVRVAGLVSANKGTAPPGYARAKLARYKDVNIITWSDAGRIQTIAPYNMQ